MENSMKDKIAQIIIDATNEPRSGMEDWRVKSAADAILSLLSKEGKELPIVKNKYSAFAAPAWTIFEEGTVAQRYADQPYVTAANARAEKAEAENLNLKKVLEKGCRAKDSQCIYQAENEKLAEAISKITTHSKTLKVQLDKAKKERDEYKARWERSYQV